MPVLPDQQVPGAEDPGRDAVGVVVELVEQQDIGPDTLDHFGNLPGITIPAATQILDQCPRFRPVHRDIPGGEADHLAGIGTSRERQTDAPGQRHRPQDDGRKKSAGRHH